jgi:hypothetical protein
MPISVFFGKLLFTQVAGSTVCLPLANCITVYRKHGRKPQTPKTSHHEVYTQFVAWTPNFTRQIRLMKMPVRCRCQFDLCCQVGVLQDLASS